MVSGQIFFQKSLLKVDNRKYISILTSSLNINLPLCVFIYVLCYFLNVYSAFLIAIFFLFRRCDINFNKMEVILDQTSYCLIY